MILEAHCLNSVDVPSVLINLRMNGSVGELILAALRAIGYMEEGDFRIAEVQSCSVSFVIAVDLHPHRHAILLVMLLSVLKRELISNLHHTRSDPRESTYFLLEHR